MLGSRPAVFCKPVTAFGRRNVLFGGGAALLLAAFARSRSGTSRHRCAGTRRRRFRHAALAAGPIAVHSLFRLEWNLRMATVVGLIGAGGVGQALYDAQQLMFYRSMVAYLLVTVALVVGAELLSERTRRYFGWSYLRH